MTVGVPAGDADAQVLQANINSLNAQITATSSTSHKEDMKTRLDRLQRELVYHYLDRGRLIAANILSTMS